MAFVDPYLMQALFTYACYHSDSTPIIPGSTIRSQQDRRLRFKNDVVKGIGQAIAGNAVTETTLACALLMSTVESISGDTSSWLVHLQGAGHLVNHLGMSSLMQSTDGDFLLRYFAYHDIMAALSTGCRTLLDRDYWVRRAEAGAARLDKAPDPFMGLADDLFLHLFDVCAFVAATGELTHSSRTALRTAAVTRAAELAKAIVGQDLHHPTEAASEYQQALIHHAEAFRYAALVYLYRHLLRFCDKGVYGRHIVRYAGRIIHHVSLVPGTIEAEMGIVFPLFMAGVAGGDEDTVAYVESRLTTIETWTRFRHVGRARGFLQLLWSQGRTDSEVLLQELGWSLSLA
jgi:hypothetical protein